MSKLHWSALKQIGVSPFHYQKYLKHGIKETPNIRRGALVDSIIFERNDFVVYDGRRAGKKWEAFQAEHAAATIYTRAEYDVALDCAAAVWLNPVAKDILDSTEWQVPLTWTIGDRECGTGGLDCYGGGILADLKVSMTANPERFKWHCKKMGWHGQMAWNSDGIVAAGRDEPEAVALIAVEPKPYPLCTVFWLDENAIEAGRRMYRAFLERLGVCEASGHWPGYVDAETTLVFDEFEDEPLVLSIDGHDVEV